MGSKMTRTKDGSGWVSKFSWRFFRMDFFHGKTVSKLLRASQSIAIGSIKRQWFSDVHCLNLSKIWFCESYGTIVAGLTYVKYIQGDTSWIAGFLGGHCDLLPNLVSQTQLANRKVRQPKRLSQLCCISRRHWNTLLEPDPQLVVELA